MAVIAADHIALNIVKNPEPSIFSPPHVNPLVHYIIQQVFIKSNAYFVENCRFVRFH